MDEVTVCRQSRAWFFGGKVCEGAMHFQKGMIRWTLIAVWLLLFGSATIWALIGSVGYWVRIGWIDSNIDGWVQAIGSIAAILVAIWVGERQNAQRLEAERQQNIEKAQRMLALARLVADRAVNACAVRSGAPEVVVKRVLAATNEDARLMRQLDIAQIPTAAIAKVWFDLIGCVACVEDDLAKLAGQVPSDGLEKFGLQAAEETLHQISEKLTDAVNSYEG